MHLGTCRYDMVVSCQQVEVNILTSSPSTPSSSRTVIDTTLTTESHHSHTEKWVSTATPVTVVSTTKERGSSYTSPMTSVETTANSHQSAVDNNQRNKLRYRMRIMISLYNNVSTVVSTSAFK